MNQPSGASQISVPLESPERLAEGLQRFSRSIAGVPWRETPARQNDEPSISHDRRHGRRRISKPWTWLKDSTLPMAAVELKRSCFVLIEKCIETKKLWD